MSPTLLELIVAALLLWVAWQIGVLVAPKIISSWVAFWRGPTPPNSEGFRPPEKNITPPTASFGKHPPFNR